MPSSSTKGTQNRTMEESSFADELRSVNSPLRRQKEYKTADVRGEEQEPGPGTGSVAHMNATRRWRDHQQSPPPPFIFPQPDDVMFGRGGAVTYAPGNMWFRKQIMLHSDMYNKLERYRKAGMVRDLVRRIMESRRFIELRDGCWHEVSFERAVQKTTKGLRDLKRWKKMREEGYDEGLEEGYDDGLNTSGDEQSSSTLCTKTENAHDDVGARFPCLCQNDVAFWSDGQLIDDHQHALGNTLYRDFLKGSFTLRCPNPNFVQSTSRTSWKSRLRRKIAEKIVQYVQCQDPPGIFLVYNGDHQSHEEEGLGAGSFPLKGVLAYEEAVEWTNRALGQAEERQSNNLAHG